MRVYNLWENRINQKSGIAPKSVDSVLKNMIYLEFHRELFQFI